MHTIHRTTYSPFKAAVRCASGMLGLRFRAGRIAPYMRRLRRPAMC